MGVRMPGIPDPSNRRFKTTVYVGVLLLWLHIAVLILMLNEYSDVLNEVTAKKQEINQLTEVIGDLENESEYLRFKLSEMEEENKELDAFSKDQQQQLKAQEKEITEISNEIEKLDKETLSRNFPPTDKNYQERGYESNNYTELTVESTAYTAYCEGCSGTTFTGQDLRANPHMKVIAVDPDVIPLGSKVWVEGYGDALAGDIGGAIKSKLIDVFIPEKEDALKWGRRHDVKVRVYEGG